MRTKSSSTAQESGCEIPTHTPHPRVPRTVAEALVPGHQIPACRGPFPQIVPMRPVDGHQESPSPGCAWRDDGLLHDVRNLVSSVSLYCDLLSMPHVLRPEHRHYADELRLLGERSAALIERLIGADAATRSGSSPSPLTQGRRTPQSRPNPATEEQLPLEGLRPMIERSAALLHCVASGHAIEIVHGDASALKVRVRAESVERILLNLVRNAAAAMGRRRGRIRVAVGLPPGDVGGMRPWPFQRVRLTVEDSGCGMAPAEVKQLLANSDPSAPYLPSSHGIGFRVVRELVEGSRGELSIHSCPGVGTRIEIEWPVAHLEVRAAAAAVSGSGLVGHSGRGA